MSNKAKIREEAEKLNPIDDPMFKQMADNKDFCQEILRVILSDPDLIVLESEAQYPAVNRQGRSAIIDAKCSLGNGDIVGIEVEKSDKHDHQRRVRYNGSLITTNVTDPGSLFEDVPNVIFIYIMRTDIFGGNHPVYHVERIVKEMNCVVDNGFSEIYVYTGVRDNSDVSELMKVFSEDNAYNDRFPVTSQLKKQLKLTEEGRQEMTATLEKLIADEAIEARAEGRAEGLEEGRQSVNSLITILMNTGRMDDLRRAAEDENYQNMLLEELLPKSES